MNRVRDGFCLTPNPFNPSQIAKISLTPEDVDAFVFWSKNPAPMIDHLEELSERGYFYYFLYTLNDYPEDLEPNLPDLPWRVATFERISEKLGPDRIIWRYDPIVISSITPHNYHRERFERLSERLSGLTRRVIISIVDFYRKTDRRLTKLEHTGVTFERDAGARRETRDLLVSMNAAASSQGITIQTCAEEEDFTGEGIAPGSCIDGELIERFGTTVPQKKDPGQRAACLCVTSRDIGVPDTCLHGCRYCYATRNNDLARRRYTEHDTGSPVLWGRSPPT
jgi:hypothetical protein